jgi:hypothetical protein
MRLFRLQTCRSQAVNYTTISESEIKVVKPGKNRLIRMQRYLISPSAQLALVATEPPLGSSAAMSSGIMCSSAGSSSAIAAYNMFACVCMLL